MSSAFPTDTERTNCTDAAAPGAGIASSQAITHHALMAQTANSPNLRADKENFAFMNRPFREFPIEVSIPIPKEK